MVAKVSQLLIYQRVCLCANLLWADLGSLAPHIGDPGPSDSALAAASSWRRRRPAADRQAAPCTFVGFEYLQLPRRKSVPPQSLLCREEPLLEVRQLLARDMVFRATSVYL